MDDKKKQLGQRICQARLKKGLSQLQLSDMIQVSTSHLSEIENGKKNFGIDIFIRLIDALDVSADWLLMVDTPSVSAALDRELNELFGDCNVSEKQLLLKMVRSMKEGLQAGNSDN